MSLRENEALPVIESLADGMEYLGHLTQSNPQIAAQQLDRLLDALLLHTPDPGVLFPLLEQIRIPICFVNEELAANFQNKPIPLADHQEDNFRIVLKGWRKLTKAYALCASHEEPDTANPDYLELMATILHRCIYCSGLSVLEHYRARRELPAGLWLDLHGYYETAEQWGLATISVTDSLESGVHTTNCAAAYVNLQLIELASPYNHTVRDLNLIRRWASIWSPLVAVLPVSPGQPSPAYVLNLMQDKPLHPIGTQETEQSAHLRHLDTSRLAAQIDFMLQQLGQHLTPSQLGLGEETSSHVTALLRQVGKPWSQMAAARRFRRFASEGSARLVRSFEGMYFHIAGEVFLQPDSEAAYSRSLYERLYTFGDRVDPGEGMAMLNAAANFPAEEWSVVNHSASGFRLQRSCSGERMMFGELVSVKPHDGNSFLLAYITWLMQESNGGLIAGLAVLPGMPRGIRFRVLDENGSVDIDVRYTPGFLLPDLPALKEEASLVLPPGHYRAGRDIEFYAGRQQKRLRMNRILARHANFDRVSVALL